MVLRPEEMGALFERAGEFEREHPESYPTESMASFFDAGLVNAPFPESLGGSGWSLVDASRAMEELARVAPSAALITAMPLGLAGVYGAGSEVAPPEHRDAWMEQTAAVASDYRAGRLYAACNSEAGAGGSLDATKTVARRDGDGDWRLSGAKILASSGANADVFISTAKVTQEDLPGAGVVEFFYVPVDAPGVEVANDWDGFGMRATESQSVRYEDAAATGICGFPDFIATAQPVTYWYCLFAAIPLGCAGGILDALSSPTPSSPALRLRLSEARMRHEAMSAYVAETAAAWRPAAGADYAARVLRMKTYVTSESTKLCAELFALGGGRHYRRDGALARLLADSFAGTALRPPLALALETMVEGFGED